MFPSQTIQILHSNISQLYCRRIVPASGATYFRARETFGGVETAALNKVLLLICLNLQETLRALCCKVSASCLPLFLTYSFSSPFLSPLFPPPAVRVIEFIPRGRRTTSGAHPTSSPYKSFCLLNSHATPLTAVSHNVLFLNPR